MNHKWRDWVADRFGLDSLKKAVFDRRVAKTPWYFGDGSTLLFLFSILVITGMLMTLSYSPAPGQAHESVRYITEEQTLGWFIRGLHYWSAGIMVVMLIFHLSRQILLGGFKSPREGTWIIGVLLFFLVLTMSFTGYVLRWDERAIYAIRVALDMLYQIPLIGERLVMLVQGSEHPGSLILSRFYAVHVVIFPLIIIGLIGFHVYLVILHGVTSKKEREQPIYSAEQQKKLYKEQAESEDLGESFFPRTMFHSGLFAITVFTLPLILTLVYGPQDIQNPAQFVEDAFPAEEWWFWWYSALIAYLPSWLAPTFYYVFPFLVFVILMALPWIDRGPYRGIRKRPVALVSVLLILATLLFLTDQRRRSPWTGWPDPSPFPVPAGVELTAEVEEGRQLFAKFGCTSCHAVSGVGRQVGSDLARLSHIYSRQEAREYILEPPPGVTMPSYRHILSDDELERLIDYWLVAQTFEREL